MDPFLHEILDPLFVLSLANEEAFVIKRVNHLGKHQCGHVFAGERICGMLDFLVEEIGLFRFDPEESHELLGGGSLHKEGKEDKRQTSDE